MLGRKRPSFKSFFAAPAARFFFFRKRSSFCLLNPLMQRRRDASDGVVYQRVRFIRGEAVAQ